jgi:hypothetical protein
MKMLFFIFVASTAFTALPPLAQSTRELQAMLSDTRFYDSLGSAEYIQDIQRTEGGYLVTTPRYVMQVDVRYVRNERKIGPVPFELDFHQPLLLEGNHG